MRAFHWFTVSGLSWQSAPQKFPLSVPSVLGQFPAAALIFRRGDLKEGPIVLRQVLDPDGQLDLDGCGFAEEAALDEHGYTSRSIAPRSASGRIDLPKTSIYVYIEK